MLFSHKIDCISNDNIHVGMGQNAAIVKLLNEAFQMENWGVNYIKVASADDNSSVYLGIGGFNIRLCNGQWRLLKK